jgi:hypothetical protein
MHPARLPIGQGCFVGAPQLLSLLAVFMAGVHTGDRVDIRREERESAIPAGMRGRLRTTPRAGTSCIA